MKKYINLNLYKYLSKYYFLIIIIICILLLLLYIFNNSINDNFSTENSPEFIFYIENENYIPTKLYFESCMDFLKKNNYKYKQVNKIGDIKEVTKNTYLFSYTIEINFEELSNFIVSKNINPIIISTENHENLDTYSKIITLNDKKKIHLLEYNIINMRVFKDLDVYYLPPLYAERYVDFYQSQINRKIPLNEKDIDILIYGIINDRRKKLIDKLSQKHNLVYIENTNFSNLCNHIERSKLVLNIYYYENNKPFDYYRLTLLLSNKILFINEYPSDVDLNIEKNLQGMDDVLILSNYNDIEMTVGKYLDNWNPENMQNIVNKQFEWFSKHKMETYFLDFIQKLK